MKHARASLRRNATLRTASALAVTALSLTLPLSVSCSSNTPADDDSAGTSQGGSAGRSAGGSAGVAPGVGGAAGTGLGVAGTSTSGGSAGTLATGGTGAVVGAGAGGTNAGAGSTAGGSAGTLAQGGTAGTAVLGGAGGTAGTGIAAGAGGSAGAAAGAAGSGGSAGQAASGFFMEDFEASTVGMQPTGWDNFISYQKNNPQNPAGSILALTDTMHVHGGTKAVHFHGDGNPAQLVRALPKNLTKLYVRAWVYMTRQLGQQTSMSANHESLIVLRRTSGNANDEVRFGEIKGVIGTNEVPSDNISPTMDKWHMATGPLVPANTWACIEVAFLADATPNTLHATSGGMSIHDITSIGTDQWQNGMMPTDWLAQKFKGDSGNAPEIVLGWQSFSSAANDVWMDDIVLSNEPIGCGN